MYIRPAQPDRTSVAAAESAAAGRVLVVDDETAVRTAVSRLLGRIGYRVTEAEDGAQAIARLEEDEGCDILVSDLRMPRLDGWALVDWIAANRPALLPRTVLLSGDTVGVSAVAVGSVSIPLLAKPYDPELLLRLVEERVLVGRRR